IRVINETKAKTGLLLDGEPLMGRAFGSERNPPVIRVNSLSTDEEKDEQKGFAFLFKGLVGLRNSKAHSTGIEPAIGISCNHWTAERRIPVGHVRIGRVARAG